MIRDVLPTRNQATLLMLPQKGPREVARGGKPRRGECLLLTLGQGCKAHNLSDSWSVTRTRRFDQTKLKHSKIEGDWYANGPRAIDHQLAVFGVTWEKKTGEEQVATRRVPRVPHTRTFAGSAV
jgi:hypothetical protein